MMLAEFELLVPKTLPEARGWGAGAGPGAQPIAGGTNLIVDLRAGRQCPPLLVDVSRLSELRGVRRVGDELIVGAGTTIGELLADPLVAAYAAPLHQAAAVFANPLVRNRATLGGNLADASPAADTAPALLALAAVVELAGRAGTRCLPLDEFFAGPRRTRLAPGELLVAVRWTVPPPGSAGGFHKLGLRRANAIAVLSAALMVQCERAAGGGPAFCYTACIALGAVAPTPVRARAAEAALAGRPLTPTAIQEAARLARAAAVPISDVRGSAAYRAEVIEVLVRRLLARAAGDAGR
jgi:CO/xanthine dehydrogenase FAD-binding subunit